MSARAHVAAHRAIAGRRVPPRSSGRDRPAGRHDFSWGAAALCACRRHAADRASLQRCRPSAATSSTVDRAPVSATWARARTAGSCSRTGAAPARARRRCRTACACAHPTANHERQQSHRPDRRRRPGGDAGGRDPRGCRPCADRRRRGRTQRRPDLPQAAGRLSEARRGALRLRGAQGASGARRSRQHAGADPLSAQHPDLEH